MAIISIPTSFKGVSIPSLGPLASLFTNPNSTNVLQYPRDLGSASRPHSVKFFISVPTTSKYVTNGNYSVNNAGIVTETPINVTNDKTITLSPTYQKLKTTISLYMPDTVNVNHSMSYQEDNLSDYALPKLGEAITELYSVIKSGKSQPTVEGFINTLTSNPAILTALRPYLNDLIPIDVALKSQGYAVNPQIQLIFKGVGLRTFTMDFLFSPYNQQEAQNVSKIIQSFKFHSAPEIGGGTSGTGLYFVPPSMFEIEFLRGGQENKRIHKITKCVLEDVNVDYAPNGWVTFADGSPIQTRMTLQFKELEIIDKAKVQQGY